MGKGSSKAEQLHAAGITKKQNEQWEKLAAVPAETFEQHLSDRTEKPTTNGVIRAGGGE